MEAQCSGSRAATPPRGAVSVAIVLEMRELRQQLSLYVPRDASQDIEAVRTIVDPVQHRLIPAHVTLCREDELGDVSVWQARLKAIPFGPLTLSFGEPQTFSGHGLLLNCIAGEDSFRQLREYLLGSKEIRRQSPHLTLAHPRNPKAEGNSIETASRLPPRLQLTFPTLYWIEQERGEPWRILDSWKLSQALS
ncbi:2'-5' RNA ligase family protein [Hyalangium versicolor]|uniref:2'-5' RNA ligase family protein n=1 Tax=Hyalangium versicolor TaxID=2861190 RepID=UPI001CCFE8EA|nr:2'-5' RNA ligase family protein [Hyalangium versicolor]